MAAVSDSSPLILYARIGRLDLLQSLFDELWVPPAVWHEVVTTGTGKSGAYEAVQAAWIRRQPLSDAAKLQVSSTLHPGEAEVIALASSLNPPIQVILDDLRARRLATEIGLSVVGSGGVLGLAKRAGLVSAVRPFLAQLLAEGLYLREDAVQEILHSAGEG
jgi:predicted nucleic acid-binding protein